MLVGIERDAVGVRQCRQFVANAGQARRVRVGIAVQLELEVAGVAILMLVGDAVSFAFGYGWLVIVLAGLKGVSPTAVMGAAFDGAIKPFVIWDILKMAFAAISPRIASCFTGANSASLKSRLIIASSGALYSGKVSA